MFGGVRNEFSLVSYTKTGRDRNRTISVAMKNNRINELILRTVKFSFFSSNQVRVK
jgi:hypothetical protein